MQASDYTHTSSVLNGNLGTGDRNQASADIAELAEIARRLGQSGQSCETIRFESERGATRQIPRRIATWSRVVGKGSATLQYSAFTYQSANRAPVHPKDFRHFALTLALIHHCQRMSLLLGR